MSRSSDASLVSAAAANLAAWHDSSLRALEVATRRSGAWWVASLATPSIWFTAVSCRSTARADDRPLTALLEDPTRVAAVCDSWGGLDLSAADRREERRGRWYAAPSVDVGDAHDVARRACAGRPELTIESVLDADRLREFERTTAIAFEAPLLPAPFDLHAPGILRDGAMSIWLARWEGELAGSAMAYDAAGVRGIYAIGTVPHLRGRGVATALTATAMAGAGGRPGTLQPSAAAAALYRRLGFRDVGEWALWV